MNTELIIIMPVYNEQETLASVVEEWVDALGNITSFQFLLLDDGSTDQTPAIMDELAERYKECLKFVRHENRGHGQSCLVGYQLAAEMQCPWVFQIDSDGQCDPVYFSTLWEMRESFDVLYGRRRFRDDGLRRVVVSHVVRAMILIAFKVNCCDPNVPYRLMRTDCIQPYVRRIPSTFHLSNIALAVLLKKAGLRHQSIPIRFLERRGGEASVPYARFGSLGLDLYQQLKALLND